MRAAWKQIVTSDRMSHRSRALFLLFTCTRDQKQ